MVSVIVAAADITFKAASGANLKALVRPEDLLVASGRFESTTWTAAYWLEQTPPDRVARTLSAWSVTSNAVVAALTALWGVLASLTSLRAALALAGLLLLATPLLLPRHDPAPPGKR